MRILVCGGRNFANPKSNDHSLENKPAMDEYRFVHNTLHKLTELHSVNYKPDENWLPTDIVIIEGGAKGVDKAADAFAVCNYCQHQVFPADWKKYGKKAGYIRNKQMLEEGKPDLVVAFPGGRGTAMMVKLAKEAGVPVVEIEYAR